MGAGGLFGERSLEAGVGLLKEQVRKRGNANTRVLARVSCPNSQDLGGQGAFIHLLQSPVVKDDS